MSYRHKSSGYAIYIYRSMDLVLVGASIWYSYWERNVLCGAGVLRKYSVGIVQS